MATTSDGDGKNCNDANNNSKEGGSNFEKKKKKTRREKEEKKDSVNIGMRDRINVLSEN